MGKYRKKPVVIDAEQWDGTDEAWIRIHSMTTGVHPQAQAPIIRATKKLLTIHTLEGVLAAIVGDWIIRGVKGEFYPCKPDIFEATYEKVVDGQ